MRVLKIALFLSVILPMGLLTTFRLGGILKGPLTISEDKTLEAVSWRMERPMINLNIKYPLMRIYSDDVSANFTVFIDDYHENSWSYGGSDYIAMEVNITTSTSKGFITFINITLWEDYESSQIYLLGSGNWPKSCLVYVKNLSITRHYDFEDGSDLKALVELAGVDHPKSVSFGCFAHWLLRSPQNYTNQLEIRFELVYFNGTAYKKVVQPFTLLVGPDDNNSFETASEISLGKEYSWLYIGPNDVNDYYKVYLNEGQTIRVRLFRRLPVPMALTDIELYSPDGKLATSSLYNCTHTMTYPINSSGYWFIKVRWLASASFYTLTIETPTQGGS